MKSHWIIIGIIGVAGCLQFFAWTLPDDSEAISPVSWQQCYSSFEEHVVAIAGNNARNCGFFSTQAMDAQKAVIQQCLVEQVDLDGPFRVGHRSSGDDSWFCDVAVRDDKGTYWSVFYDSDVSGGSGGPSALWISECQSIKLQPGTIGRDSFFDLTECEARDDVRAKLLAE